MRNLSFSAIMKEFLEDSDEEALKAFYSNNLSNLSLKYEPVAFVEYWPGKSLKIKEIVDKNEFFHVLQEKKNAIKLVQSLIKSSKKMKKTTNSSFFCEFRKNEEKNSLFFYKKFFIYENSADNPLSDDYLTENSRKILKIYDKIGKKREIIAKSLDSSLNEKMEKIAKKIDEIFRNPAFFLRKIMIKFIIDQEENLVFKGIKEIQVEFRGRVKQIFEKNEEKEIEFEAFVEILEGEKKNKKDFSMYFCFLIFLCFF